MNTCRRLSLIIALMAVCQSTWADPPAPKKPITEDEARAFCEEYTQRFLEGDGVWLSDHIDIPGMAWRATDGQKDAFSKSFRERSSERNEDGVLQAVQNFVSQKDNFQSYKFKQVRNVNGTWKGLFRLINNDEAMNFHELDLVRKANGEIGASEFYVFITGETLTDTFRQIVQDARASMKSKQGNEALAEGYEKVREMTVALQNKQYQVVCDLYDKIPEHLQGTKVVKTLRLQAAANLDPKFYQQVMEDYSQKFPSDPSKDFISIDAFFLAKKYDLAVQSLDRLLERLDGDGHLSFLKATIELLDGKPEQSIRIAKDAMKGEPDHVKLYEITLNASLKTKDHGLTKEMLETLETKFGFEFVDLNGVPDYSDFVKSPEYKAYMKAKEKANDESKPEF